VHHLHRDGDDQGDKDHDDNSGTARQKGTELLVARAADKEILAAGVVLLRKSNGERLVAVLHRPTHSDWSLPKGKLDADEHIVAAARRETIEETGCDVVLGMPLRTQRYRVDGRPKSVRYWLGNARPGASPFVPNREIDRLEWLTPKQAANKLSYSRDVELVAHALRAPDTSPLIILRHAQAVRRSDWGKKRDELRPLAPSGFRKASQLTPVLRSFGIREIHSSTALRCIQSIRGYASEYRFDIELDPVFGEENLSRNKGAVQQRLAALINDPKPIIICTHRPVLPTLLRQLANSAKLSPRMSKLSPGLPPGGFIVIHRTFVKGKGMKVVAVERHPH